MDIIALSQELFEDRPMIEEVEEVLHMKYRKIKGYAFGVPPKILGILEQNERLKKVFHDKFEDHKNES